MDFSNRPQGAHAPATATDPATRDEDALRRCAHSNSFFKQGDYEGATHALGGLWRGAGARPATEGLGERAAAEVLIQAGRLTSALDGAPLVEGAQEAAKNLLSEGAGIFERLGDARKVAEARTDLGVCYWREGAFEEARVVLRAALEGLAPGDAEQRALALTRLAVVELSGGFNQAAVEALAEAAPHVEACGSDIVKGTFHAERANAFVALADAGDAGALDRALDEYTAAIYHLERAGHARHLADNENNLALLLQRIGRHEEARQHLARARALDALVALAAPRDEPEDEGDEDGTPEERWEGFSLKSEVMRYEAELISRALRDADGVVSRAAKLLGFKHHQTFVALLNNRHRGLLGERRPVVPRRRSYIRRPRHQAHHAGKKD